MADWSAERRVCTAPALDAAGGCSGASKNAELECFPALEVRPHEAAYFTLSRSHVTDATQAERPSVAFFNRVVNSRGNVKPAKCGLRGFADGDLAVDALAIAGADQRDVVLPAYLAQFIDGGLQLFFGLHAFSRSGCSGLTRWST